MRHIGTSSEGFSLGTANQEKWRFLRECAKVERHCEAMRVAGRKDFIREALGVVFARAVALEIERQRVSGVAALDSVLAGQALAYDFFQFAHYRFVRRMVQGRFKDLAGEKRFREELEWFSSLETAFQWNSQAVEVQGGAVLETSGNRGGSMENLSLGERLKQYSIKEVIKASSLSERSIRRVRQNLEVSEKTRDALELALQILGDQKKAQAQRRAIA